MTVKELKQLLNRYADATEVHFAYPLGDYWRTTAAPPADTVQLGHVRERSDGGTALTHPDDVDPKDWDQLREVLIIR